MIYSLQRISEGNRYDLLCADSPSPGLFFASRQNLKNRDAFHRLPVPLSPSQKSQFNSYRGPRRNRQSIQSFAFERSALSSARMFPEPSGGSFVRNSGVRYGVAPRLILTIPDMQIDATGSMQIAQTYDATYRLRDDDEEERHGKKKNELAPSFQTGFRAQSNSVSVLFSQE